MGKNNAEKVVREAAEKVVRHVNKREKDLQATSPGVTFHGKSPKRTGKYIQSEMLRVDRDFAKYVREQARAGEIPVTEVTRGIWESLQ